MNGRHAWLRPSLAALCALAFGACSGQSTAPPSIRVLGLGSGNVPGVSQTYVAVPSGTSEAVTFGFPICSLTDGVKVTAVRPTREVGAGFSVVAIRAATFDQGDGITLASPGYPPEARPNERIQTIEELTLIPCDTTQRITEIQIGLRKTSAVGGGWSGATVDYTVDGRKLSVEVPYAMLLCGTSTDPC